MALSISIISLLSVIMSVLAIYFVFSIYSKVYSQKHRRPWLFIGVCALFLSSSELLRFVYTTYGVVIVSTLITEAVIYLLVFISMVNLAYGLLLEHLILTYYKGKFVKMKFVPVQEGSLSGDLDINVSNGNCYLALKKDRKFLIEQFATATKKGFEGFFISEDNPKKVRTTNEIYKTPIAWVTQLKSDAGTEYSNEVLDENSDLVDPIEINDIISYVDNFLEQSSNPFILIDLNLILKVNSFYVATEFLKYISSKIEKYNGIGVFMINLDVISKNQEYELKQFLKEFE
jgi:hypothetical protein